MRHQMRVSPLSQAALHACAVIVSYCLVLSVGASAWATVRAEPSEFSFGVVKHSESKTQVLHVINDGEAPIKVTGAEPGCKMCTKVTLQPTQLAPGKSTNVSITFTPVASERDAIERDVTIFTDSPDQPKLTVRFNAYVTDTAGLVPWELTFSNTQPAGTQLRQELELVNVSNKPLKMLYATSPLEGPRLIVSHKPVPPGGRAKLQAVWDLPGKAGSYNGSAIIYVDHPQIGKLVLPYAVRVVGSISEAAPAATRPLRAKTSNSELKNLAPTQPASVPHPSTQPAAKAAPAGVPVATTQANDDLVHLELKDSLTLRDLVEVIAAQLKLNLVFDEQALNVPIAVRLSGPLHETALLPLLRSVLQAKGFALVATEQPDIWRIVPAKEAPQSVRLNSTEGGPGQMVTEVISPAHMDIETLAGILKGFVTSGQLTPVPDAKLLIVTDYKTQVDRLKALVTILDKGSPKAQVGTEVVPLKEAEAGPLSERVNHLYSQLNLAEGAKPEANKLFISADTEHNQIVLVGRISDFDRVRQLIQKLDTPPALIRQAYTLPEDQRDAALSAITQLLGPTAHEMAADGSPRLTVTGATASVAATDGTQQRIREALSQYAETGQSQEIKLKAYRVQNRDAAEIQAILTRLLGNGSENSQGYDTSSFEHTGIDRYGMRDQQHALSDSGVTRVGNPFPPSPSVNVQVPLPATPTSQPSQNGALAGSINITVDAGTNSLLVAATPEMQRRVAELIEQLDQRQAQVLLEVMLVSVSDSDTFSYAVEAAMNFTRWGVTGALGSDFGIGSGDLSSRTLTVGQGFNSAVFNPGAFSVFLRALNQTNKAKVISLPQVLAVDNKPATIRSVQQQPFTSINASQTVSTTSFGGFAEAGTTLQVTPHIAPADYLNLEYQLEVSSFTGSSSGESVPPPRRSDTVSSYISVPDGNTVIVGGLSSSSRSKSVNKIPGLGDIPILGLAGRSQNNDNSNSTFYIFVRPTILRASRFEDLKYLSQQPRIIAGLPADYPPTEPLLMME